MYSLGDLRVYDAEAGVQLYDARGGYDAPENGAVYLPHSCDQWVIGGPDQIRELIRDLEEALDQ